MSAPRMTSARTRTAINRSSNSTSPVGTTLPASMVARASSSTISRIPTARNTHGNTLSENTVRPSVALPRECCEAWAQHHHSLTRTKPTRGPWVRQSEPDRRPAAAPSWQPTPRVHDTWPCLEARVNQHNPGSQERTCKRREHTAEHGRQAPRIQRGRSGGLELVRNEHEEIRGPASQQQPARVGQHSMQIHCKRFERTVDKLCHDGRAGHGNFAGER